MKVLKFEGATMRDAIAKVKAELGDQAVIIATRQIRRGLLGTGFEISAATDDDADDSRDARDDHRNLDVRTGPMTGGPMSARGAYAGNAAAAAEPQPAHAEQDVEKMLAPLRSEIRSLRALVRAGDGPRQPQPQPSNELRGEVAMLRKLVDELRGGKPAPATTSQNVRQVAGLTANRPAASALDLITAHITAPSTASAIALVGPTGAGKTTTIAKLAARAALIENRRVQLVTLDDYRVGGVDQIRTFAELIGIPLHVSPSAAALRALVADTHALTLIDTAGRSPRDTGANEELADRFAGMKVEVHLVAPASTDAAALDTLAARYAVLSPSRLLITKLDEVDAAPDLQRAPVRLKLPITWVTTGQAVPEDIEEPSTARVVELATRGLAQGRAA